MTMVLRIYDEVRGKVIRLKGDKSVMELAPEMGLTRPTLSAFMRGEIIGVGSLMKIEAWCNLQEEAIRSEDAIPGEEA